MSKEQEINLMKCWLFRNATIRWKLSPAQTANLFKKYGFYQFVTDCYELLHVSGYDCALDELENVLAVNGEKIYA